MSLINKDRQPRGDPLAGLGDYSTFLARESKEKKVTTGPGGATIVVAQGDTTIQATRDDYVPTSQYLSTVLTSDPFLDQPRYVRHEVLSSSMQFLGVFMSFIAQEGVVDTSTALSPPPDELAYLQEGNVGEMTLEEFTSLEAPPRFGAAPPVGGSLEGPTGQEVLDNLSSADAEVVYAQLKLSCGLPEGDDSSPKATLLHQLAVNMAFPNRSGNSVTKLTTEDAIKEALTELGASDDQISSITESIIAAQEQVVSGGVSFESALEQLTGLHLSGELTVSPESQAILDGMGSTDSATIEQTLLGLVDLSSLSPEDVTLVKSKIHTLADNIALANETGGAWPLQSTMSSIVLTGMVGPLGLTDAEKDVVSPLLATIAEKIAEANNESLTSAPEASLEYTQLTSADPEQLTALFSAILGSTSLPSGIDPQSMKNVLQQLAVAVANGQIDLATTDADSLKEILTQVLNDLVASGSITQDASAAFISAMLPSLVSSITDITSSEIPGMLKSGDPKTIRQGLTASLGSTKNLTAADKAAVEDYLTALTKALAFIAQIRSLIVQLEGKFTQELSSGKLSQISDQINKATAAFTSELKKIADTRKSNLKAIEKAKWMRIFMPLLTLIIAIVMTVVTIVGIVGAPFTGGASAVAGIAATAGLVVALVCTITVATLTLVDAVCTWASGKGMMQLICDKANIKDPALQALLTFAINMVVIIVSVVCTLGVGAALIPGMLAKAGIDMSTAVAKEIITASLKACVAGVIGRVIVGTLVSEIFASGIVMAVLVKLLKLFCKNDVAAMVIAMIINLTLMIAAIVVCAKALPKGATEGAKTAVGGAVSVAAKDVAGAAASVSKDALEVAARQSKIMGMIKKILDGLKKQLMSGQILNCIEIFTKLLSIVQSMIMATTSIQQGLILKEMARIQKELTAIEAGLSFLHGLQGMDPERTIRDVNEAAVGMQEDWTKLIDLVGNFIQDASQRMSGLATKGTFQP